MCQPNGKLKLCTCKSEIDRSKPYWELYSKKENEQPTVDILQPTIVGSFTEPHQFYLDKLDFIEAQLNSTNDIFDFPYAPNDNDKLKLYWLNTSYTFTFFSGLNKWRSERYDLSDKQPTPEKEGYIAES